jgi:hypothetical protein
MEPLRVPNAIALKPGDLNPSSLTTQMRDLLPIREGHVLHMLCDRLLRDGGDVGRERSRFIRRHKAFALPFRIGWLLLPARGKPVARRVLIRW